LLLVLSPLPARAAAGEVGILVTSNGWHSGIVVSRADIPAGSLPETADFTLAARWFEFGWGAAEYYPAREPTLGMTLRAALGGPAVIHVAGLAEPYDEIFPTVERVPLCLPAAGFRGLIAAIDASFARGGAARARSNHPGLYSFSLFYPANGTFNLVHTCNSWTARMLRAAGLPIEPARVVRVQDLLRQLRPLAGACRP
jgi:uncharacterized protein (TIGR02117 family)